MMASSMLDFKAETTSNLLCGMHALHGWGGAIVPDRCRVTMYGPAYYELWIQGRLDPSRIVQMSFETIRYIPEAEGGPITILGTTFRDQAELRGLLDRIYNLNLPLISVRSFNRQGAADDEL